MKKVKITVKTKEKKNSSTKPKSGNAEQKQIDRIIKAVNKDGETLLHHVAAHYKDIEVSKFLISKGANVNAKNGFGETPLHVAVKFIADIEVIKLLVSFGADVNKKNDRKITLVLCQFLILGYRVRSFTLAFSQLNCQMTPFCFLLHCFAHASTFSRNSSIVPNRPPFTH